MQACYPLGALIGSAVTPRLIERVGHVRSFGALASLCSIASIVHLITTDPWNWGAMRFLAGLCFPGLYVIAESWRLDFNGQGWVKTRKPRAPLRGLHTQ